MRSTLTTLRPLLQRHIRRGEFTLSSGKTSDFYLDCRPVTMSGVGASLIAGLMLPWVRAAQVSHVGGPVLAACPIVTAIAVQSYYLDLGSDRISAFYVRAKGKDHGVSKSLLVPEMDLQGRRVILVDDVLTSGGSLVQAATVVAAAGGKVQGAFVIVDRQEGGREVLKGLDIEVRSIFTRAELDA